MSAPTERQVDDWLKRLGRLVASNAPPDEISKRLAEYVPQLITRYSAAEFDSASREHVARRCKFFPSYAELCDALDCLPSRAPQPTSEPDTATGLTQDDRNWLAFWHKRRAEIWAQVDGFKRGSRDADMANLTSLVRSQSPRAWAVIEPSSVVIRDQPSDAQVVAVARALRMPGGPLAGRPMPEEGRRPSPKHAPPEQLDRMRRARGVRVPEPLSPDDVYGEAVG